MFDSLITELEYNRDRITLYNDVPSKEQLVILLEHWLLQLKDREFAAELTEHDSHISCEQDAQELREALADAEERIRQAKEIL